jgi:4'-phosphopantetheinyl transferase
VTNQTELWRGRVLDVELACLPLAQVDTSMDANLLSPDEAARAAALRAGARRREYIATRVLLRRVLGDVLGVAPQQLAIAVQPRGKPYARDAALQFNLSHAGDALLVGWGSRPLGVDLERATRATHYVERLPLVRELSNVGLTPLAAFTLIEAALKADGRGLAGLRSLRLRHAAAGTYAFELAGRRIEASSVVLSGGYLGAVATLA